MDKERQLPELSFDVLDCCIESEVELLVWIELESPKNPSSVKKFQNPCMEPSK